MFQGAQQTLERDLGVVWTHFQLVSDGEGVLLAERMTVEERVLEYLRMLVTGVQQDCRVIVGERARLPIAHGSGLTLSMGKQAHS
jgi:hypothetical protein